MLMLHSAHFLEEAERLIDEVKTLDERLSKTDFKEDEWIELISARPGLIQCAALELRMGFENAAYKALASRKKAFNPTMFDDWRANKVVEFVSEIIDEGFTSDTVLSFCETGEEDNPEAWKTAIQTKGIKKERLARSIMR